MMANRYYDDPADVEVVFQFNNQRRFPAQNGYRPAHKISPNCLTTGVHHCTLERRSLSKKKIA